MEKTEKDILVRFSLMHTKKTVYTKIAAGLDYEELAEIKDTYPNQ